MGRQSQKDPYFEAHEKVGQALRRGDSVGAAAIAEEWSGRAERAGRYDKAASFRYGCSMALFMNARYSESATCAERGKQDAVKASAWNLAAVNAFALSQVYANLGNNALAEEEARTMMWFAARDPGGPTFEMRIVFGGALRKRAKYSEAMEQFRMAAQQALTLGAFVQEAAAIDQIAFVRRDEGSRVEAEAALTEAFRLRRLHDPANVGRSYLNLSQLRLQQGRAVEALRLADLALQHPPMGLQPQYLHFYKAKALLALGKQLEAIGHLRLAVEWIQRLRMHLPLSDEVRVSSEASSQEMFSATVQACARQFEKTGKASWMEEALQMAMEGRAAAVRNRLGTSTAWRRRLPEEYGSLLAQVRQKELQRFSRAKAANPADTQALKTRLAAMEVAAAGGTNSFSPAPSTAELRSRMAADEMLVLFHVGEEESWQWFVYRGGMRLQRLAGRGELARQVDAFASAVNSGAPERIERGRAFYQRLFGALENPHRFTRLTIAPDDRLFDLPFAALISNAVDSPVHLAEHSVIRLVPAVFWRDAKVHTDTRFAGVADAVFNRADPRYKPRSFFKNEAPVLELPSLPASARELSRSIGAWGNSPHVEMSGIQINAAALLQTLREPTAVLHLATHVIQPPGDSTPPIIHLGLGPRGEIESLNADSIAAIPVAPRFVTMSGCSSGRGLPARGEGLIGLTRAWLMAGSTAVVASLWPVPDDSGNLFNVYYRALRTRVSEPGSWAAAASLQKAQLASLRSGDKSWAAYFVIGWM
ncbi:MAG: CHAT domain-containing protein [Candidatus Solibacter usitatus]|nr:CHAT domain-containing protein [Candidatus Solibacter usitatus]